MEAEQIITTYLSNPWVVLVGYLLGIIGAFIAIRTMFINRRLKRVISYAIRTTNVVTPKNVIQHLKITYKGEETQTLSVTNLLIYCSGKLDIRKEDIPNLKPIQLESKFPIYDIDVTNVLEEANNIKVLQDDAKTKLTFTFDYLTHNQGAIIKLYHNGKVSSDITVSGTIIDGSIQHIGSIDEPNIRSRIFMLGIASLLLFCVWIYTFFNYFNLWLLLAPIVAIFISITGDMVNPQPPSIPTEYKSFNDDSVV